MAEGFSPAELECVDREAAEIEAALDEEFGGWSFYGGRAVWCDLPGVQAEASGRDVFAPLDSSEGMAWALCSGGPDYPCEPVSADDVRPTVRDWVWECSDGATVRLGAAVSWDCAAVGASGDRESYVSGTWDARL